MFTSCDGLTCDAVLKKRAPSRGDGRLAFLWNSIHWLNFHTDCDLLIILDNNQWYQVNNFSFHSLSEQCTLILDFMNDNSIHSRKVERFCKVLQNLVNYFILCLLTEVIGCILDIML